MARPLQDGSPPEPVESIPNDGTRPPLAGEFIAPDPFFFEDCVSSQSHLQDPLTDDSHPYCRGYPEPQDRRSSPIRTVCSFCRVDHSVYADRRHHLRGEQLAMAGLDWQVEDGMVDNGRVHRDLPEQERIGSELAARLRRIGDEMNTTYLQRAFEQERHRVPLIWHFYHFISEVLAVFFNPQGNIMP